MSRHEVFSHGFFYMDNLVLSVLVLDVLKTYQAYAGCEEFCDEMRLSASIRFFMCGHAGRDSSLKYIMDVRPTPSIELSVDFLPMVRASLDSDDSKISPLRKLVAFALKGLNDPLSVLVWDSYVHKKEPLSSISFATGYSERHLRRLLDSLPNRMALFLVKQESRLVELETVQQDSGVRSEPTRALPGTGVGVFCVNKEDVLNFVFCLTPAEIELFFAYTKGIDRGQRVIAQELCKSIETIKSQKKSIMEKVRNVSHVEVIKFNSAISVITQYFNQYGV